LPTYVTNATRIADIIVPSVFNPYVIQRTAELSAFSQSGIITNSPELDRLAFAGGKFINMPYFNDLAFSSASSIEPMYKNACSGI